jgi:hypothetical protein
MTSSCNTNSEIRAQKASELPGFNNFSLIGVKEKVANILDLIGSIDGIFSTYTIHNIRHVDAMLNMLDWLIPPSTQEKMTPLDWLMIVLSIYFHDLGMVVTSKEYAKRMDNPKFVEFFESLDKDTEGKDYISRTEKMTDDEKDRFFYQEFVRMQHATRIREWITGRHSNQWGETIKPITDEIGKIMEDLPPRFKEHLAVVCESHHKDDLDKIERYPLCQHYGSHPDEIANVQYSALILRTADLVHVTNDRTPSIMYKTIHISDPKGVEAWKKQRGTFSINMKSREFKPEDVDSHIIIVSADFDDEPPFFALTEYLAYADEQIKQSKRWAEMSQKKADGEYYIFPWHTIKGDILVEGNEPLKMSFSLDKGRLLDLLVGHTIYNDPTVAVRELLQNAIDAVRFQHHLDKKETNALGTVEPSMGTVLVNWNPETRELIVEDNGIGMNLDVIKFNLMKVGASFYDTPIFHTEYADFNPISQFGIGILTCFMISDDIEIITYQQDVGYRIKMSSVKAEYLSKKLETGHSSLNGLEPHGTRVKLKLRSSIDLKERSMLDIIKYWIILPECEVLYSENGNKLYPIGFKDISKALDYFHFEGEKKSFLKSEDYYEIINFSNVEDGEKYEFSFVVLKRFTPERNFIKVSVSDPPAVCIEGIRADNILPGFEKDVCALLSVRGNKKFRTTVSRSALERDDEYVRIGKICAKFLSQHLENEVNRISEQSGKPLSQASSAGLWIFESINNPHNKEISDYLYKRYSNIPLVVIEKIKSNNEVSREMISYENLKKLETFWTIESRLVDYLGIISRDLGRELSLNDFLGTLAPELRDPHITPVVPDAYMFKNEILSSHSISTVEFSRKHQQTLIQWKLLNDVSKTANIFNYLDDEYNVIQKKNIIDLISDYLKSYEFFDVDNLSLLKTSIATGEIIGDMKKVSVINTRLITILKQESKAGELWTNIINTIKKVKIQHKYEDLANLYAASYILNMYLKYRIGSPYPIRMDFQPWKELALKVNDIFNENGINDLVSENLSEIISQDDVFDASRYWLDWMSGK